MAFQTVIYHRRRSLPFTLFQFHWKNKDLDKLLYLLLIAGFIQAVYGTVQLIWQGNIVSFMAPNISHQGYGIFQQINLQASFQATMLLICLYALTRPGFKNLNIAGQIVLFLCLFSSTYMIAIAGSRVGILSATIGIVIIFAAASLRLKTSENLYHRFDSNHYFELSGKGRNNKILQ
ncbi:hypothetical protein [Aliamphritea spongicola]|nr:hypothetical protein [Aliamphritea spongicola]